MSRAVRHYETHVTLAATDAGSLDALRSWAQSCGLKWTQIVLDSGQTPLQPMLSFWGTGDAEQQRLRAEELSREVAALHGTVVRIKIEAALENAEVPRCDRDVRPDAANYFEHHVKTLLAGSADLAALQRVAERNAARLSQNARRQREDGRAERFVTQRIYHRGADHAQVLLEQLLADLRASSLEIVEVEQEYVVFDSAIHVDAGWLEPK